MQDGDAGGDYLRADAVGGDGGDGVRLLFLGRGGGGHWDERVLFRTLGGGYWDGLGVHGPRDTWIQE